jgi:hypothetical protein
VKSLIRNFFLKRTLKPPVSVLKGFAASFHNSINIEWSKVGDAYEALFYEGEIEKIARFDKKGLLIEIRTNISPSSLPKGVYTLASAQGEFMNAICILRKNQTYYEIIIRKDAVKRYLLLINQKEEILKKEKL